MSPRFLTVAEAAHYLRLNPPVDLSSGSAGRDSREPRDRQVAVPSASPRRLDRDECTGSGRVRGAPPASDLALSEGGLFLAGSDDPAREILPDALRGQAGHPLLSSSPLADASGGLRPGGGASRRGRQRPCGGRVRGIRPVLHPLRLPRTPRGVGQRIRPGAGTLGLDGQSAQDRRRGRSGPAGSPVRDHQLGSATRAFTDEALAEAGVEQGGRGDREEVPDR